MPYVVAQLVGSFLASALVYATYNAALENYLCAQRICGMRDHRTGSVWTTFPAINATTGDALFETTGDGCVLAWPCHRAMDV